MEIRLIDAILLIIVLISLCQVIILLRIRRDMPIDDPNTIIIKPMLNPLDHQIGCKMTLESQEFVLDRTKSGTLYWREADTPRFEHDNAPQD